jgi:hypothetical protein
MFAIAPVEIPLKQRVTHHHALARIFITGLRKFRCTFPWHGEYAW